MKLLHKILWLACLAIQPFLGGGLEPSCGTPLPVTGHGIELMGPVLQCLAKYGMAAVVLGVRGNLLHGITLQSARHLRAVARCAARWDYTNTSGFK